jgi:hypothetical protein
MKIITTSLTKIRTRTVTRPTIVINYQQSQRAADKQLVYRSPTPLALLALLALLDEGDAAAATRAHRRYSSTTALMLKNYMRSDTIL